MKKKKRNAALSPLWIVTQNEILNGFILKLQNLKNEMITYPDTTKIVEFTRTDILGIRDAFSHMLLKGEQSLHTLCELICESYFDSYRIESIVIGEIEDSGERFTLSREISREELFSTTDIDLGNRQINKIRFKEQDHWSSASLISNVVSYQPENRNELSIHRLLSRIKAEEQIWNKVVDEIFDLDKYVAQDKELRHLSRFIKDVFGIKFIVQDRENADEVYQALQELVFDDGLLESFGIVSSDNTRRLQLLEFKDYMSSKKRKESGWEAYKAVFLWGGKTFEIQIQTLYNFLHERELLTKESHNSFKARREQLRDKVSEQIPILHFFRILLNWLFTGSDSEIPKYKNLRIEIND